MKKKGSNTPLDYVGHVMSVADLLLDLTANVTQHKQAKNNMRTTIGTHLALTVIAAGISAWQTTRIMECIRKEAMEGPNK